MCECLKASRDISADKLIVRWKMVSRGTERGVVVTRTCDIMHHSHSDMHFSFFLFLLCTWTQFYPPPPFSSSDINDGRFKLCTAWQTSGTPIVHLGPFSSEDFQMGSLVRDGNTSPRSFRNLSGEAAAVEALPQNSGADYIYVQCVSVVVLSTIFHSFHTDTL